ncbi:N-acetyltransferase family 8 member 3 [Nothobranchius furzeri]|uniref:N-acetylaspartate synthetase-like n=1 Tax=Nothobranchius furzeri TaxID=105023 RepID=A0A1A8A7A3_NOTFU|nr:N-acetylaspartate synthetase [Nothobranchius furzeri]KAF7209214.1 N-acetylaspartate synthetase-like [Nothobranchius furzeri]
MAHKDSSIQFSIREFQPADQHVVMSMFHEGILEHVYPAFFKAMSNSDHIGVALSISVAGYILGGSSYFQAFLFGAAWAGLIYYCCREIYEEYMTVRLNTDMANIQATYLENPDNSFWVAEADVKGQAKVVGMLAVRGRKGKREDERFDECNGGMRNTEFTQETGNGRYGEISHVIVMFPWRRSNLGSQLTRKALDFCKERGFSRLSVAVSSPQAAAISMFQKLGFIQTISHHSTHVNRWFSKLARINMVELEKNI